MPMKIKDLIEKLQELKDQNNWVWIAEGTWRGKPYITEEPIGYILNG